MDLPKPAFTNTETTVYIVDFENADIITELLSFDLRDCLICEMYGDKIQIEFWNNSKRLKESFEVCEPILKKLAEEAEEDDSLATLFISRRDL